jgi:AmiR/NasT family two-component response regulator
VLSQRGGLDMDQAFALLRRHARDHGLRLTEVARAVVTRELSPDRLIGLTRTPAPDRP